MKQYPTEAARAEGSVPSSGPTPPPAKPAARKKFLTQKLLPVAIFVVVIGGITVASQFGINRRAKVEGPPPKVIPLKFDDQTVDNNGKRIVKAVWDPYDPPTATTSGYIAEFEGKKKGGHYHFLFRNPHEEAVELGFTKKSCRCANLDVCWLKAEEVNALTTSLGPFGQRGMLHLINLGFGGGDGLSHYLKREVAWEQLVEEKHKDEGMVIEPGIAGLVRLSWKPSEKEESEVGLTADLWMQMKGNTRSRKGIRLAAAVSFVPAVRSFPDAIEIKDWNDGVAQAEFRCWSATRPHFSLEARGPRKDRCVEVRATPLSRDECDEMQLAIAKVPQRSTHVLSGYRVHVTVHQVQGDDQLEQGHFDRYVTLRSKEVPAIPGVKLSGYIPSDVMVGEEQNKGKIRLGNFRVSQGKSTKTVLWTNPGVELQTDRIESTPKFMKVRLHRETKGGGAGRTKWSLELVVPPNPPAVWPRDPAIVIYTKQSDEPARRVRIPIIANPFDHQNF
jgi:hypothetical protein